MREQEREEAETQALKTTSSNATTVEKKQRKQIEGRRVLSDHQERHRQRTQVHMISQDSFTKRLGNQMDSGHNLPQQQQKKKKTKKNLLPPSISSQKPRTKEGEEIAKGRGAGGDAFTGKLVHWRELEVAKVSTSGCICSRPCNDGSLQQFNIKKQRRSIAYASSKPSALARSHSDKQLRGMGALLARKFFRQNTRASNPAWEAQWAKFREQHKQEMKEMKQMYAGLQEMCQEIKRLGLQRAVDADALMSRSSRCVRLSESSDLCHNQTRNGASLMVQNKWAGGTTTTTAAADTSYASSRPHQIRRTKSAPKTRVNLYMGLTKENRICVNPPSYETIWCWPTAALFEEIVQVERVYLHNFCARLVKFAETGIVAAGLVTEGRKEALTSLVARLIPHTTFAKPWHFKYGIEAWINKLVFQDFGKASLISVEDPSLETRVQEAQEAPAARRVSLWEEYQKLSLLSPIDAIDQDGKLYDRSFHVFCQRKFQVIHDEMYWWDKWPNDLIEDFLQAVKHVWRAHKLALVFEAPASIFCAKPSQAFDEKFMETLEASTTYHKDDELLTSSSSYQAGFSVAPGFIVQDHIIKTQVYLIAKSGNK